MPFISKTNKTRRGRMTTRRNVRSVGGRVSIPTTTTGRVSVAKSTVSAVRQIAKSVVRKEAETKYVSSRQDVSFNSTITTSAECYPIMPAISQGSEDCQREGSSVRGKYLYLKGHIQYNAVYIQTPGVDNYVPPSTVRVLVLSQKNLKSNVQVPLLADFSHLLKDNLAGVSTARPYLGGMTDNLAPINKDLFKVHLDKKVKMKAIYQNNTPVGGSGWVGLPTSYFSVRIKLPATLYFDDTNGDNPNNFAPFFCLGSVLDDGSTPFSAGTPYRVTWLSTAYYEDP